MNCLCWRAGAAAAQELAMVLGGGYQAVVRGFDLVGMNDDELAKTLWRNSPELGRGSSR